jgi:putative ABC transport system ATP-binding protein
MGVQMLRCEHLKQTYRSGSGTLTVLQDISFTVDAGEFVAIVGPSGSGKTTLLGLLAGLDRPAGGRVWLEGDDLTAMDEDARAALRGAKVGFVFQSYQLIPTLTALENVQVPLELRGERDEGRARELLVRVGLGDRTGHYPAQLSGGEQQRVALARAFSTRPKLLFADEPTGNLDTRTSLEVMALFQELNGQGLTVLMVTHEHDIARYTRRVVELRDGRIIRDEPVRDRRDAAADLTRDVPLALAG